VYDPGVMPSLSILLGVQFVALMWALMVIGIDVLIIWALASHLRQPDVTSTQPAKTPQTTS
jgi:hypothetical protein